MYALDKLIWISTLQVNSKFKLVKQPVCTNQICLSITQVSHDMIKGREQGYV